MYDQSLYHIDQLNELLETKPIDHHQIITCFYNIDKQLSHPSSNAISKNELHALRDLMPHYKQMHGKLFEEFNIHDVKTKDLPHQHKIACELFYFLGKMAKHRLLKGKLQLHWAYIDNYTLEFILMAASNSNSDPSATIKALLGLHYLIRHHAMVVKDFGPSHSYRILKALQNACSESGHFIMIKNSWLTLGTFIEYGLINLSPFVDQTPRLNHIPEPLIYVYYIANYFYKAFHQYHEEKDLANIAHALSATIAIDFNLVLLNQESLFASLEFATRFKDIIRSITINFVPESLDYINLTQFARGFSYLKGVFSDDIPLVAILTDYCKAIQERLIHFQNENNNFYQITTDPQKKLLRHLNSTYQFFGFEEEVVTTSGHVIDIVMKDNYGSEYAIEVDGNIHNETKDKLHDHILQLCGYKKIYRISNAQIEKTFEMRKLVVGWFEALNTWDDEVAIVTLDSVSHYKLPPMESPQPETDNKPKKIPAKKKKRKTKKGKNNKAKFFQPGELRKASEDIEAIMDFVNGKTDENPVLGKPKAEESKNEEKSSNCRMQ